MNRKLSAIAIMAILILSVLPFAFAEDRAGTNSGTGSRETEDADDSGPEDSAAEDRRSERRGNREAIRDLRTEGRDARADIREKRVEKKDRFNELRDQIKSTCKGNRESTECESLRGQARGEAKAFLTTVADRILMALNNAKAKIEASDMDADTKARLIAGVDARISAITAIKTEIDALPENPSRDEVKALAKELRDAWKESRNALRVGVGRMVNNRMAGIIEKSDHLSAKLAKTLERLSARGIDTSGIEADVDAFNQLIVDARAAHTSSVELFASGDVDAAKAAMDEARQKLKDAHEKLKAIVAAIKAANSGNLGVGAADTEAGATA